MSKLTFCAQDHDGSHIKGLLINFLDHFYPSLLKLPNFLVEFVTPIVRVRNFPWDVFICSCARRSRKGNNESISSLFQSTSSGWRIPPMLTSGTRSTTRSFLLPWRFLPLLHTIQGLGTSKDSDARYYFSNMAKHMIPFATTQDGDRALIDLAFSKKKADDRKEWLRQFKVNEHRSVCYHVFIRTA